MVVVEPSLVGVGLPQSRHPCALAAALERVGGRCEKVGGNFPLLPIPASLSAALQLQSVDFLNGCNSVLFRNDCWDTHLDQSRSALTNARAG